MPWVRVTCSPAGANRGAGRDLLAVTGDVLNVPLTWYTDFEVPYEDPPAEADARERVVADYRLLRAQLDVCGVRYVVLPGNHDWAEPFWEVFGDTPAEVIVAGHYHKGMPMIRIGDTGFSVGEAFCEPPFAWRVFEVGEGTVEVEKYESGEEAV